MSALLVLFSSCTGNDDEGSNGDGTVLLRKIIESSPDGDYVTNLSYDGTKIRKMSSDDGTVEFTYTGDNITKATWKEGTVIIEEDIYTYGSDGKLATYVILDREAQIGTKEVFTHNSDNTVTVQNFSGDLVSQTVDAGTHTMTFANGEVSQIVFPTGTTMFAYDNKNNPFKNVTGYGKVSFVDGFSTGILHNVLMETDSDGENTVYTYTYNSNGYPTKSVEEWDGEVYTTNYVYN